MIGNKNNNNNNMIHNAAATHSAAAAKITSPSFFTCHMEGAKNMSVSSSYPRNIVFTHYKMNANISHKHKYLPLSGATITPHPLQLQVPTRC